jgi:hypothetical protein
MLKMKTVSFQKISEAQAWLSFKIKYSLLWKVILFLKVVLPLANSSRAVVSIKTALLFLHRNFLILVSVILKEPVQNYSLLIIKCFYSNNHFNKLHLY